MPSNPFSNEGPKPGPFLSRTPKRQIVLIVRNEGTQQESSTEVWAHIQETSGFFDPGTLVHEGDIVVVEQSGDGDAGKRRLLVVRVNEHTRGARYLQHVQVTWGRPEDLPAAPVRRTLDVADLHAEVQEAAEEPLSHGSPGLAVHRAFTALEKRVHTLTGPEGEAAHHDLEPLLRNVLLRARAAPDRIDAADSALAMELLALASLLHRTIDHPEG